MPRNPLHRLLALASLIAGCATPTALPPMTALPPLQGRAPDLGWHVQGPAQALAGGTVTLIQPATGTSLVAGSSGADGRFTLYVPPTVTPATGSTWLLELVRRRQGIAQGLRTVIQWDGTKWLSCTNGTAQPTAEIAVTPATTAAADVCLQAGLPLEQAIGTVKAAAITLPAAIPAAWPAALQAALAQTLADGDDPLARPAAVVTGHVPASARAGETLTWQGFGLGTGGSVRIGRLAVPIRQWQDQQVSVDLPAGLISGPVTLTVGAGRDLRLGTLALDGGWTSIGSLAVPRGGDALAVGEIGGSLFVAGGQDGQYAPIGTVESVSATGRIRRHNLGKPRFGLGGAVVNGRLYAIGGDAGSGPSPVVEIYDPASDTWTDGPPLPVALYQPAVVATGGQIVVIGGDQGTALSSRIYRLPASGGTWQTSAVTLSPPRTAAAAVAAAGTVIITGGRDAASKALATVERYDPVADTLVALPSLQVARYGHGAASSGTRVVVGGGWQDATAALGAMESWLPGQTSWLTLASLPTPRFGVSAASVGDAIWFVGGANDSEGTGAEVWQWRP